MEWPSHILIDAAKESGNETSPNKSNKLDFIKISKNDINLQLSDTASEKRNIHKTVLENLINNDSIEAEKEQPL